MAYTNVTSVSRPAVLAPDSIHRIDPCRAGSRVERELTKWEPEGPLANLSLDMPGGKGGHWDQFEANRKMFQVRASQLYAHPIAADADRYVRKSDAWCSCGKRKSLQS